MVLKCLLNLPTQRSRRYQQVQFSRVAGMNYVTVSSGVKTDETVKTVSIKNTLRYFLQNELREELLKESQDSLSFSSQEKALCQRY